MVHRVRISLSLILQLMFEGTRGNTAYLDISLDGLSIQRGTCNRSEFLSLLCASPSPDPPPPPPGKLSKIGVRQLSKWDPGFS